MLFVEGIGGTGKAIVNLLQFIQGVGKIIEEKPNPQFECAVIDQDARGVWDGVDVNKPIGNLKGQFRRAYGITTLEQECTAHLFYSDIELGRNVEQGFHGCPRLVAALSKSQRILGARNASRDHVIVYSDIGGTGAGVGPVRLIDLLQDPSKRYVIAIVFGKYLNTGIQNPVGYEWLRGQSLGSSAGGRCFLGFYISVPPLQVGSSSPPPSGLNPTPALLLATAYVWRLAIEEEKNKADEFLEISSIANGHARISRLEHYLDAKFSVEESPVDPHSTDLVRKLWKSAQTDDLSPLLPKYREHLGKKINDYLDLHRDSLASHCWNIFAARRPMGGYYDTTLNWDGLFNETFASVADEWGAAEWFHKAVQWGNPRCQKALLNLAWLFLEGKLYIFPTRLREDEPEIYVLSTLPLARTDSGFQQTFERSVVGAFSSRFPFWTVPAYLPNLEYAMSTFMNAPRRDTPVVLELRGGSAAERAYKTTQLIRAQQTFCSVQCNVVQHLSHSLWDWAIHFKTENWQGWTDCINEWQLLKDNVTQHEGVLSLPSSEGGAPYRCEIRGIHLRKLLLDTDGVFVGEQKGFQYYTVRRIADNKIATEAVLNEQVQGSPQPKHIEPDKPVSIMFCNVMITGGGL